MFRFAPFAVRLPALLPLTLAFLACTSKIEPTKDSAATSSAALAAPPSAITSVEIPSPPPSASAMPSAVAPEPAPENVDPDTVTAVLVWKNDPKVPGKFRTSWVERDGDKPKVVAERPGILFLSNSSLWKLETTIVKGCSQLARHPDGEVFAINGVPQRARPDMQMPEIVRITDGARVAPWKDGHGYPYTGTQCDPAIDEYSVDVTFDGGMGPFVVTRMRTYLYASGAHGFHGEDIGAINLDKQAAVKFEPQPEDRIAVLNSAAKGLSAKPDEVKPNGAFLMYGPNGSGLALYRYFASAAYSEGSGGNSYSNDFDVSSKKLPLDVAAHGKLPKWTLSLLTPKPVPIFMIPPGRTQLFKSQFDAAYASAPKP